MQLTRFDMVDFLARCGEFDSQQLEINYRKHLKLNIVVGLDDNVVSCAITNTTQSMGMRIHPVRII